MKKRLFADVVGTTQVDVPELDIWIECRNELSIGEERKSFAGAVRGQSTTEDGQSRVDYDAAKLTFGLVLSYVTDWSAKDEKDKSVQFSEASLRALTPEAYHAIEEAVDRHKKAMVAAKTGKAETATENAAAQISASAA